MNLLEIYHRAEQEDPQLQKWQAAREASRESHHQTKAKALLPSVSLKANVDMNFQTITQGGTKSQSFGCEKSGTQTEKDICLKLQSQLSGSGYLNGGYSQFMSGGYTLSLTQPLFHYDRLIAVDQAGHRIQQSEVELETARQDLMLRATERYFGMLGAMDNLILAQAQKRSLSSQLEQTRQRFNVGEIAIIDVTEAEAGYDRAVADEIEAEHQLEDAKAALREITGEDSDNILTLGEEIPLVRPEPADEHRWIEQAMQQNPRIATSQIAAQVASDEIKRQSSEHLPTLDLVGGSSFSSQSGGQFGSYEIQSNNVGLQLNIPIYEGGQVSSRTREAAHRHEEALAALKQEQRNVHRQTLDAYHGVIAGISRVQALRQTMRSQERQTSAIKAGIEVGSRTTLDHIRAEHDWYRTQRDYAKARYDYLLNTVRLKRSTGILVEEDLLGINTLLTNRMSVGQSETP
ncbi:MAG: TolC family outer membrane protein [Methylococcaceae bacterium]|nr:TolC family outer membrane protein [Methylococcaceae bacterium]